MITTERKREIEDKIRDIKYQQSKLKKEIKAQVAALSALRLKGSGAEDWLKRDLERQYKEKINYQEASLRYEQAVVLCRNKGGVPGLPPKKPLNAIGTVNDAISLILAYKPEKIAGDHKANTAEFTLLARDIAALENQRAIEAERH
jgi:hypothetical protein